MIITGLFLGVLTFIGFALLFIKLPRLIKNFLTKHSLVSDAGATTAAYVGLSTISSSIVGAIACAIVGILVSGSLWVRKNSMETKSYE